VVAMEKKYAWDVACNEDFSSREIIIAEEISSMITRGFEVKEMRIKLTELKALK